MQHRFLLLFTLLISLTQVQATTFQVTSLGDSGPGSLREIMGNVNDLDTVNFTIQGPIFLQSYILVNTSVYLIGGEGDNVVLSSSGQNRIFDVANDITLHLVHLTLRDGYTGGLAQEGGGAIRNSGTVYATDCLFLNNAAESGGAITNESFAGDTSLLYLERCSFIGNRAYAGDSTTLSLPTGGALYSDTRQYGYTEIRANNCTFSGNHADQSGGILFLREIPFGNSRVSFRHCTLVQNSAGTGVGGIHSELGRFPVFEACIIAENTGDLQNPNLKGTFQTDGNNLFEDTLGADFNSPALDSDLVGVETGIIDLIEFSPRKWLHATACTSLANDHIMPTEAPVTDQRGEARVGLAEIGAYERVESKDLGLTNSNDSGLGSFRFLVDFLCPGTAYQLPPVADTIHLQSPIVISEDIHMVVEPTSQIILNGDDSTRLFEVTPAGLLTLDGFTLTNGASGNVGGGAINNQGSLTLRNSSLVHNQAAGGGAIANYAESGDTVRFTAINSTFSHNIAEWLDGGAIDNRSFGGKIISEIRSCTFAFNEAFVRGGAIHNGENSDLLMGNTLIDRNLAPTGEQFYGDFDSEGYNLIRNPEGIGSGISPTDVIDIPSNLFKLDQYGGPTPTHALPVYSVAVNAGNPSGAGIETDQRGLLRIFGTSVDIGAVEYQGLTSNQDQLALAGLKLYPNPGKEMLLEFDNREGPTNLQLLNSVGQTVWQTELETDIHQSILIRPELPTGTYLLQINNQIRRQTLRVVFQ